MLLRIECSDKEVAAKIVASGEDLDGVVEMQQRMARMRDSVREKLGA